MKKSLYVCDMFNDIAGRYDLLNNIISLGMNKNIRKQVIKNVPLKENMKILDICTGTGDMAILLSKLFNKKIEIIAVDFSEKMLEIAKKKTANYENIKFIKADALNLQFENGTFDAVFISFGLRNLDDLNKSIAEMKRVTKNNGFVVNLDTGKPKGFIASFVNFYFFNIMPFIGKIISGNSFAYSYLAESAKKFPSQEELIKIFTEAGFKEVKNYNFAFGAIAQQIAKK